MLRRILLLAVLLVAPLWALAAEVTYLEKPAQVKRRGTEEWLVLRLGDEVFAGDTIRTGTGARVEITLGDKRVFRIGQATEIELPALEDGAADKPLRAKVKLILGRFWGGLVAPLKEHFGERFEVSTATATIGVKGTQFGVDHEKETDRTTLSVVTGAVEAQPPPEEVAAPTEVPGPREIAPPQEITRGEWLLLVQRDQKLVIRPGEVPEVEPLTPEDKADPWVQFNLQRDAALAAQ